MHNPQGREFVYLAYCDDSETHDKRRDKFQVLATVLIEDKNSIYSEVLSRAIANRLIPADRIDQFEEFHACELFGGYGIFDGIKQDDRFDAINSLLGFVNRENVPIIYGAVNKHKLDSTVYASVDPVDACFAVCMKGVENFISEHFRSEMALLIVDDFSDRDIKKRLRSAFRKFRTPLKTPIFLPGQSWHLHDDMYFGDSKESSGIQIADLCSFFVRKHLEGGDPVAEAFFNIIKDRIVYSRVIPDGEM